MVIEWIKAVLYGIVEGITEWLPISSTGHLILLERWLPFAFTQDKAVISEYWEMFEVVIQLGAILAVVVMFWGKLWTFTAKKSGTEKKQTLRLWLHVIVGCIPAGIAGIIIDKLLEKATGRDIDGWLYNAYVVSAALVIYGIAFIIIERVNKDKTPKINTVDEISYPMALKIGFFQALSIIPGTSRSGSTILGSMLMGLSRTAAAEFSFFLAIPVMCGASLIKALGFVKFMNTGNVEVPGDAWVILIIGCIVSFAVSMAAIKFLMDYVRRHSFSAFGVYRIILGALVLLFLLCGLI